MMITEKEDGEPDVFRKQERLLLYQLTKGGNFRFSSWVQALNTMRKCHK